ncbi:MAG: hypothetical protein V4582_02945 [Pseudomonadota bacterium]
MSTQPLACAVLLAALCCAALPAQSRDSQLSKASQLIGEGSTMVLSGSLEALAASGALLVRSVEASGEASVIVIAGASEAGSATIRLSGRAARDASLAAGTVINVSAIASGYMLIAAGKVIAFVPNEVGKSLVHHSRVERD